MGLENADVIYRHYRAWEKGFCKDKECAPEKSIRLYVQNHLPTNAMKAIADLPGNESNRMLRWLKEMKIPVIDTLKGYCVSKQDFSAIHAVLAREKPVYPVFKAMCEWANILRLFGCTGISLLNIGIIRSTAERSISMMQHRLY